MDLKIFQNQGKYLMLAFDHRGSFKKYVKPEGPESATHQEIIEVKRIIIESLQDQFSGLLIDEQWGLPAYISKNKPYLLPLEKSGYIDTDGERNTELEYTAKQLRGLGAGGSKLLLYFNPDASNCNKQIAIAKQALEDSHQNNLPFFLEIVTYGNEVVGKTRAEWVLRSVEMLLENNVVPDVWKLEYPGDLKSCQKITQLVSDTPWILLTRGETFEVFAEQLRMAMQAGAAGFLAGRALWQEIEEFSNNEERQEFLDKIVKNRFKIISDIALGK